MKHPHAFILILFLVFFLYSCTESGPAHKSSEVLPISTTASAATETGTETTTVMSTKTATATKIPLFTKAELEKANSFDDSTWPDRFKDTQLHPELATEQQWQDEYQWILALRKKDGIPKTENNNYNPQLQSFQSALTWEQNHPDEVKSGKKIAIAAVEYRAMIEEQRKAGGLHATTASATQTYKSEIIGPILGRNDIDSERRVFDTISGKLAGFGTIGGEDVLLIDVEDPTDGYHILFPVVVYVGQGLTLVKGSICLVEDTSYANRHGGDSTFTLKYDTELGPLGFSTTGKAVSREDLYVALGKDVDIFGGGYMPELQRKTGVPEIHGFSPLNLEIASQIYIHNN